MCVIARSRVCICFDRVDIIKPGGVTGWVVLGSDVTGCSMVGNRTRFREPCTSPMVI